MGLPESGPCALSARRDVRRIVTLFKASYFCKGKKADVEAITVIPLLAGLKLPLFSLSLSFIFTLQINFHFFACAGLS